MVKSVGLRFRTLPSYAMPKALITREDQEAIAAVSLPGREGTRTR